MIVNPKEVALNLLAGLGPVRAILRRFRDRGDRDDYGSIVDYSIDRLTVRRTFIGDDRIRDATLLEIGSGKEMCVALLLLALGARKVINVEIDPYRFVSDPALYRRLIERAAEKRLPISWPPAGLLVGEDGSEARPDPERIDLHLGRSAESLPAPDKSIDVTFSVAVLEHIRPDAMPAVAAELRRVTRPGGVGYHRIDLVDHYYRKGDPFRFLRLSPLEYRLMYARRGSSSNRFRIDDFDRIFRAAGFPEVSFEDVRLHEENEGLRRSFERLHRDFRDRDRDMLRALECMLVLRG